jgi:glycosyltransferase involved in cell wall biosynthesis
LTDGPEPNVGRVCLIVPAGTFDATELAAELSAHQADLDISAVWAGDPHRRPAAAAPGVGWADLALDEPLGIGWGRLLTALTPEIYEWARASRSVARLLRQQQRPVVVLRVGSIGVAGDIAHLIPRQGVMVVPRALHGIPYDGRAPSEADRTILGSWSASILGVAPDAVPAIDALGDLLSFGRPGDRLGPLIELALGDASILIEQAERCTVAGWSGDRRPVVPYVLDIEDIDRAEPWHLSYGRRRPRAMLSADPNLADAVADTHRQWVGERCAVSLPGGVVIDTSIRTLMSDAIAAWAGGEDELPPEPFVDDGLLEWLESPAPRSGGMLGRYWFEEWARRPDLHAAFAQPTGADRAAFITWAAGSWRSDGRSPLIRARTDSLAPSWVDVGREAGVNLIGYVSSDSGLGDFSRRIHSALEAAQVPNAALHYHRTASPTAADVPPLTTDLLYDTNLMTVHADQMVQFEADHGTQVFRDRASIGFWFWELSHLPKRIVANVAMVDEVWAATEFIADAFRAVTDKPVNVVHVPVPKPSVPRLARKELGLPDGRFVFLVTLDHLSITDRKNPLGAIRAFERAFPAPSTDGPVLLVKTLNGRQRWSEHEQLQLAAAARPDITVIDQHVSRAHQMALISHSDCLVSLHRSEGLGLHLMEAMWLDTPVIATRYSGNLEFMTDDNSALVDFELIPVTDRQGYYPPEAVWADPDLDAAASAMRRMVEEEEFRAGLAEAGRSTMMEQPSPVHAGHLISGLCRQAGRHEERS